MYKETERQASQLVVVWESFYTNSAFFSFSPFHTNHNASCLPPKFCITDCFQFLLGITPVQREIKDKGYAKCRKVHKVCFRLCENGE